MIPAQSEEVGRIGRVAMLGLKEIGMKEQGRPFRRALVPFQLREILSLSCHASLSLQEAFLGSRVVLQAEGRNISRASQ